MGLRNILQNQGMGIGFGAGEHNIEYVLINLVNMKKPKSPVEDGGDMEQSQGNNNSTSPIDDFDIEAK